METSTQDMMQGQPEPVRVLCQIIEIPLRARGGRVQAVPALVWHRTRIWSTDPFL